MAEQEELHAMRNELAAWQALALACARLLFGSERSLTRPETVRLVSAAMDRHGLNLVAKLESLSQVGDGLP